MNYLNAKRINTFSFLLSSVANGVVAFLLFSDNVLFKKAVPFALDGIFAFNITKAIVSIFIKTEKKVSLFEILLNLAMLVFFVSFPGAYGPVLALLIGLYAVIIGFVNVYSGYIYGRDKVHSAIIRLVVGFACFLFGVWMIFYPSIGLTRFKNVIAGYFALIALSEFAEFLEQLIPLDVIISIREDGFKRFAAPKIALFTAFIPSRFLDQLKKYSFKHTNSLNELDVYKTQEKPDLEIFIHVTDHMPGRFGHIDLAYKGVVYTYGNYDEETYRLGGLTGDGVFQKAERNSYIAFCLENVNKTVCSYGLKLDEVQKKAFEEKLDSLFSNVTAWRCRLDRALSENPGTDTSKYTDYASKIWLMSGSSFYKINSGRFKTFFGLNTNCVRWAGEILESIGISQNKFAGVITPGMYYDYLNRELKKAKSQVISREIYTRGRFEKGKKEIEA